MTIHEFTNTEYGIRSEVHETENGCRVILIDTDANQTFPHVRIFPTSRIDEAIACAKSLVQPYAKRVAQ